MSILRFAKNPTIALRLVIWFLVIALLPMLGLGWWTHREWKQAFRDEVPKRLVAVAQNKAQRMERYAQRVQPRPALAPPRT